MPYSDAKKLKLVCISYLNLTAMKVFMICAVVVITDFGMAKKATHTL